MAPNNKTENISAALLRAQQALESVAKDSRNDFGKYKYTSADAMIAECRKALHGAGLVAYRKSWSYDAEARVTMEFVVVQADTGQQLSSIVQFPAIVKGQMPLDKAVAAALTSAMNYWLRDLLLLPRFDELEMDKRNDAEPVKNGVPAGASEGAERADRFTGTGPQIATLSRLCSEAGINSPETKKELWKAAQGILIGNLASLVTLKAAEIKQQ